MFEKIVDILKMFLYLILIGFPMALIITFFIVLGVCFAAVKFGAFGIFIYVILLVSIIFNI